MSLTRDEFRSEVQLACRNMPTSDPYYGASGEIIDRFIVRGRNKVVRMGIGPKGATDRFPELRFDWTIGPTVAGENMVARPADCLAIDKITKQESSVAPPAASSSLLRWAGIREQPVTYMERNSLLYLSKDTETGYATLWTREGKFIQFYPTADADHIDYFHGYGIRREVLSASGDAFVADEFWDDPTIMVAAAMIMERRGWYAKSRELYQRVEEYIAQTSDVSALEGLGGDSVVSIQGAPTRASVYRR